MCSEMKRLLIIILILLIYGIPAIAQGLAFNTTENSIEARTSFDVFAYKQERFEHNLDITFKMQLPLADVVGYVARIIDKETKQIYNVFFDGRGNDYFSLNEEGYKTLIKCHFDRNTLRAKQWFDVRILFDLDKKTIYLTIDDKHNSIQKNNLPNSMEPRIIFGRSDYLIDVPSFTMRDLIIGNKQHSYNFPLQQVNGNDVYTVDGKMIGYVQNPYWAINNTYHWKPIFTHSSKSPAGHAFSTHNHEIYYFNRDSLYSYKIMSEKTSQMAFSERCPLKLYLGTCFVDENIPRLYAYEISRVGHTANDPAVASLDLNNYTWQVESNMQLDEGQMHHHGAYYNHDKQEFTIYGGFANMTYHSKFYTYSINEHRWDIQEVDGTAKPRYYCAMGYDQLRYVYIFGGMGNESGDQTVGRMFYYDLYRLDLQNNKVEKMWNADWGNKTNMVFVKDMVIKDGYFYTLGYPEFLSDSYLKLYRFSLADGSYTQLGDSIPIHPNRIETEARLFYDPLLRMFVATVQEFTDEKPSVFNAYVINDPVLSETEFIKACQLPPNLLPWYIAGGILATIILFTLLYFILRRRKAKRTAKIFEERKTTSFKSNPNAIYLFGNFQAFDSNNHDISYLFTDKLRSIFCLLIQYNNKDGLSSRNLGNIIWGDKEPEKIKNSKSVAINYLRRMLGDIDGIEVIYQNKNFSLNITEPFYCDYLRLMQITETDELVDANSTEILQIVSMGKFMSFSNLPTLDAFKSDVESKVISVLMRIMHNAVDQNDTPTILDSVQQIFVIDPTNEDAYKTQVKVLKKMGRDLDCIEAQLRFKENYKQYYGTDYQEFI